MMKDEGHYTERKNGIWVICILKFSIYLPNYLSLTLQARKTFLILKVEFAYISGDQYEKQAYGT